MAFVAGSMRTREFSRTVGTETALWPSFRITRATASAAAATTTRVAAAARTGRRRAEHRRLAKLERLLTRRDQCGARRVTVIRVTWPWLCGSLRRPFGAGRSCARSRWVAPLLGAPTQSPDASPAKRGLAGEALVEEAAERVDVRSAVDRPPFDLLGGEVGGRSTDGLPLPGHPAPRAVGSARSRPDRRARSCRGARWRA